MFRVPVYGALKPGKDTLMGAAILSPQIHSRRVSMSPLRATAQIF